MLIRNEDNWTLLKLYRREHGCILLTSFVWAINIRTSYSCICMDTSTELYNEWMNDLIWLTCDKKAAESQFSPTHASTKKITKKLNKTLGGAESVKAVRLKSSGQFGGYERIYGGKDLWNKCVLSLEWKREEVMMVWRWWQMMNEVDGVKPEDKRRPKKRWMENIRYDTVHFADSESHTIYQRQSYLVVCYTQSGL